MTSDQRLRLDYILQTDVLEKVIPSVGADGWQSLYLSHGQHPDRFGLFCALVEAKTAKACLEHDSWDIQIGDGLPGFSQGWNEGREETTYHRFGALGGIRPLVIYRQFHGAFPGYPELCEEFRHYHDLAHDQKRNLLLDFDRSGYEIEVVRIASGKVEARLKYLREFQAGTGLYLGIYIDSVRYSNLTLGQIPPDQRELVHVDARARYTRHVVECDHIEEFATFSRLLAKVLLPPPNINQAGVWPFSEADRESEAEVSFIFGTDHDGRPVECTSNPNKLDNYFGANPGAPHYLTPIYFRRDVLSKYYADPDRYTVSDGHLSCLGLWGCQIDNNHPSHVVVFLGDLGRDLPPDERLHWKQFNVPPEGGVSEPNFRRSFLAQWSAPTAADLVFRQEYMHLNRAWQTQQGWFLFLPPEQGDEHLIDTVRVPVNNSQAELDAQVLSLAKLLVDSLNEKALEDQGGKAEAGDKGITKFARFLKTTNFKEGIAVVQLLRDLQTLRSTGSGHRKGSAYHKILADLGADARDKPMLFKALLQQATTALVALGRHYCPGYESIRPT